MIPLGGFPCRILDFLHLFPLREKFARLPVDFLFVILYRALQLPPEAWLRISLAHASITKIVCRPNGTVTVKTLGGSEHMPPEMVTYS